MSVTVRGLSKRFRGTAASAVRNVEFEATTGAITTLVGPSGSGKTTVLRMIAGLEIPDAGRVLFGDVDVTDLSVQERRIGFVFQGYGLFDHMTVRENIGFGLRLMKASPREIDERVRSLLELVELGQLGDRYPRRLSGGQRQRVAFARALATNPRTLLLDEPFGALDARVRVDLRDWLLRLHDKTHLTTILVTHDQDEALEVSHRVVVMYDGQAVQTGAPDDIYDHPATPFVASFIGNPRMLRGHVESGRAALGPLSMPAPAEAREGAAVQAFVRPHDVRITKPEADTPSVSVAIVDRLSRVGRFTKIDLTLSSGDKLVVQMPKSEVDALQVDRGDRVMVDLGEAKIFVGDYSI